MNAVLQQLDTDTHARSITAVRQPQSTREARRLTWALGVVLAATFWLTGGLMPANAQSNAQANALAGQAPDTAQIASTGGFSAVGQRTRGSWAIETRADGQYVVLSDDFKTRGAPDLKIFLSPRSADTVTGGNATSGSVLVSALKSKKGAQSYKLPAGVDLNDFESLVIHCEQYSKFWAAGGL